MRESSVQAKQIVVGDEVFYKEKEWIVVKTIIPCKNIKFIDFVGKLLCERPDENLREVSFTLEADESVYIR